MNPEWRTAALEPLQRDAANAGLLLRKLTDFSVAMLRQRELDDLLWTIADHVGDQLGYEDCVLYLLEPEGLVQWAAHGVKNPTERRIHNRIVIPRGRGVVGSVAESGRPERITDVHADPRYIPDEFTGRSELAVPISFEGQVLGVLDSESSRVGGFDETDEALFVALATLSAPRIASALSQRRAAAAESALAASEQDRRRIQQTHREESLESLGLLAGGIAHDFNNLLASILGNVSLAREGLREPATVSLLEEAEHACVRAQSLTKQLLTFSQGGQPVRRPGDLCELLRETTALSTRGSDVQLRCSCPEDLPPRSFDAAQMAQVFQNITVNAVQACGGVGRLDVHASVDERGGLSVRFHDDGPGVPEELRDRIFEPYFTTKSAGTGIGLATSYWILRRHGGDLALDPTVETGACFVLRLPPGEAPSRARAHDQRPSELPPSRILVMDDQQSLRRVLEKMLRKLGHSAEGVDDGAICIQRYLEERAKGTPFDLVVLDLTVPDGLGGRDTLALLRETDPEVRAIVASGYSNDPILADHRRHGFAACLEKPFTGAQLRRALAEAAAWSPDPPPASA